jgi:predicted ArsR family transcriptional regulator
LTHQAQRHNLDGLASALLDEFINTLTTTERNSALKRLGNRLLNNPKDRKSNLPQRLFQAVTYLNELKYQARWEAHAVAPRLILGHCPYAAILLKHPELCHLDSIIIEQLITAPVRQTDKLNRDAFGMVYCTFVVEK